MKTTFQKRNIFVGFIIFINFLFSGFSHAKTLEFVNPYKMLQPKQQSKNSKVRIAPPKLDQQTQPEEKHFQSSKKKYKNNELLLVNAVAKDKKTLILLQNLIKLGLQDYSINGRFISGFLRNFSLFTGNL